MSCPEAQNYPIGVRAPEDTILRVRVSSLGLPAETRPKGERRMVDQNSASWNPLISWLCQIDQLWRAA